MNPQDVARNLVDEQGRMGALATAQRCLAESLRDHAEADIALWEGVIIILERLDPG